MTENKTSTEESPKTDDGLAGTSHSSSSQSHNLPNPKLATRLVLHMKLPQFWSHNPEAWINVIESKFRLAGVITQENKYISTIEAISDTEIQKLHNTPNPEDQYCYDNLVAKLRNVFARDDTESLDILLNDLTLGDQTPDDLRRHIIAASGADQNCPL